MKLLSSAEVTALQQRTLAFRNLLWLSAKSRTTGLRQSVGFWDDVGTVSVQVYDALTGAATFRNFIGAGSLLRVDDVVATADLSIKQVTVVLSGVDASVAAAVRGYEARLAPIELYRLILNPASGNAVAPARPRFVGLVDELTIVDPVPGREGTITLQCVSQMRELTRANPDMTSDSSQELRIEPLGDPPIDRIYQYANDIMNWKIMWGAHAVKHNKKDKKDKDKKGKN